jgi:hypothetical protein
MISPSSSSKIPLHLLNGGYGNGDKALLEKAAKGGRKVPHWVVPKAAAIGDEVVINVADNGLFATGRIASPTRPATNWRNRYSAALDSIRLIEPSISLASVKRHISDLAWARYPRSITTPKPNIAKQVRELISERRKTGMPDLDDATLEVANIDELRAVALLSSRRSVSPQERKTIYRRRSKAIRLYVLRRAEGYCEACTVPAPFDSKEGTPYLEAHHVDRVSDDGPDHPSMVIALCPNCHRRTEFSADAKAFNDSLRKKLAKLEPS